jgi:hypothetical protein
MRKLILTLTAIGITGLLWAQPQGTLRVGSVRPYYRQ